MPDDGDRQRELIGETFCRIGSRLRGVEFFAHRVDESSRVLCPRIKTEQRSHRVGGDVRCGAVKVCALLVQDSPQCRKPLRVKVVRPYPDAFPQLGQVQRGSRFPKLEAIGCGPALQRDDGQFPRSVPSASCRVVDPGCLIDSLASFQQSAGERVTAIVAGEFFIGDHAPQACARGARADAEQRGHCDELTHRETSLVSTQQRRREHRASAERAVADQLAHPGLALVSGGHMPIFLDNPRPVRDAHAGITKSLTRDAHCVILTHMSTPTKSLVAHDVEIVRRILAHIDAGTTDEGDAWREPVENYRNPGRFADELRLLRSLPSVLVPSAAIPNPGDHVERDAFGVPLFAVRGRDQRARVFRNSCRHRGLALVEGAGCSRALVCPYHGWTYRLDGSLSHVPHADAFPDLDMSTRGLVEVASHEVDGIVVIGPLDTASADGAIGALTDGSPWRDKLMPAERLVYVESTQRAMNWKILVEQFLEGYHIRSTHASTFFPLQYDDLNVVETFGPNSRITFPYRNIERLRDRPEATWTTDARVTYVYHLFPNAMLATFPDLMLMVVIDPIDVDQSTVTIYSMVTPEVARRTQSNPGELNNASSARTLLARGAVEDNEMSAGVQRGLHAGANQFVEFGRHESAIGHFHAALDERLARLADAI
jgi:choline monooxygenase